MTAIGGKWSELVRDAIKFHCSMIFIHPDVDNTLMEMYKCAKTGLQTTQLAFERLNKSVKSDWVEAWTLQESKAMYHWGESLQIYQVTTGNCMWLSPLQVVIYRILNP